MQHQLNILHPASNDQNRTSRSLRPRTITCLIAVPHTERRKRKSKQSGSRPRSSTPPLPRLIKEKASLLLLARSERAVTPRATSAAARYHTYPIRSRMAATGPASPDRPRTRMPTKAVSNRPRLQLIVRLPCNQPSVLSRLKVVGVIFFIQPLTQSHWSKPWAGRSHDSLAISHGWLPPEKTSGGMAWVSVARLALPLRP